MNLVAHLKSSTIIADANPLHSMIFRDLENKQDFASKRAAIVNRLVSDMGISEVDAGVIADKVISGSDLDMDTVKMMMGQK